jgi:hypothetical protein
VVVDYFIGIQNIECILPRHSFLPEPNAINKNFISFFEFGDGTFVMADAE